ncbi:glycosyltransferase family 4 protein [Salegentibacter sp. Hel_I_6]|uniref:glycosyltransferase family 4 protein n=1 Tax=Salegentibacter sp. Hel_I_6 TaxID=1250278 RepID=UPI00056A3030|nr:glycosyltransferase family 4 protein [Salegentibacter sp. Hel_I_6]
MRLLYYTTSYYANHGGSIQSIEFYKQLDNIPMIKEKAIFPPKVKKEFRVENESGEGLKNKLKAVSLFQVIFFFRRSEFYMKALEDKIRKFEPDVLFMQIDSNFLQIHKIKNNFPDLKICTQINGSPFDEPFRNIAFKNKFQKLQRKAYIEADLNIFISDYSRSSIMGDKLDKIRDIVIHNGTDTEKFFPLNKKQKLRKELNYNKESFIIGYIGTLDHHKKLEILIQSFADLKTQFTDLQLVIIGDGPAMSKLLSKVSQLNLEDSIEFRGWIKHDEINKHLNSFDLAVHHYANTYMNPLKIFEYLSAGLPVIAPRIPSVEKMFKDGEDLLLTSPDEKELKKHLFNLITDEDLRKKLSNKQHLIASMESNFTWKKYTERIVEAMANIK